jgi:hypothetical protein
LVEKGWNALTTSWNTVQDLKGIATYAPYVVYPDSFCVGNLACWGGIEEGRRLFNENVTEPQRRREELGKFASRQVQELAHTNSLEAMALLAEYVAAHTKTSNDFMNDMALSILGSEGLESTVLPVMSRGAGLTFNSRGFNETYADPSIENNQVNHFWFFVNAVYQLGPGATGTVDLFAVFTRRIYRS